MNEISSAPSCDHVADESGRALLLFQAGPVQEFICQARSTRDLWSGSYLLSWLMAHAIRAIGRGSEGEVSVIFPCTDSHPLFALLSRETAGRPDLLKVLVPSLPNRFLAEVPAARAQDLGRAADGAFRSELRNIANRCWEWLAEIGHPIDDSFRTRFDKQMEFLPQIAWQSHPLEGTSPADWRQAHDEVERLLAARRNLRDFAPWKTDDAQVGARKDSFSGKEEVIGTEPWWKAAREKPKTRGLFKSDDVLGAPNLVKRVWHVAYLKGVWELDVRKGVRFESVPDVAAAGWRDDLRAKLDALPQDGRKVVFEAARAIADNAKAWDLDSIEVPDESALHAWVRDVSPEVFLQASWRDAKAGQECAPVLASLSRLYGKGPDGAKPLVTRPPQYVAIIALDGDEMGKWMSGEKTPGVDAREHIAEMSRTLARHSIEAVRPVVEDAFGQLIYAGGDDVLCMVPADRALECAARLREEFREHGCLRGAEVSAGIAMGHINAPLQMLVRAAQSAERRAKGNLGRAAFSIALFKRSGEIVEWGAKWSSGAIELLRAYARLSTSVNGGEPGLSGKFAYALEELVAPYRCPTKSVVGAEGFPVWEVLDRELDRVLTRQSSKDRRGEVRDTFVAAWEPYREHLKQRCRDPLEDLPGLLRVANFMLRGERE